MVQNLATTKRLSPKYHSKFTAEFCLRTMWKLA